VTTTATKRKAGSIRARHTRTCTAPEDACSCRPSYEASVRDKRSGKKVRATFATEGEAEKWVRARLHEKDEGRLRTPSAVTLRAAAEAWLKGADAGQIRTRSGDVYKPSVLRGYRSSLERRILDDLGALKLSEVRRNDVQDLADRMLAAGSDPSTIRNTVMPLRVICRRAVQRGELAANPCTGLELPAVRGKRDRIASREEAIDLLAALPEGDRPLWATAFYAGLRLGELRALRIEDVDLVGNVVRVERSWDQVAGVVEPKSRSGRRTAPIASALRTVLLAHRLSLGRSDGLIFGRTSETPFNPSSIALRSEAAWKKANGERAEKELALLQPITLHECRHTYASLMIAAGVNAKTLSTYMGHSSVTITFDRYGHLMPGNEAEAAALLDAYLEAGKAL
jgi:integrase